MQSSARSSRGHAHDVLRSDSQVDLPAAGDDPELPVSPGGILSKLVGSRGQAVGRRVHGEPHDLSESAAEIDQEDAEPVVASACRPGSARPEPSGSGCEASRPGSPAAPWPTARPRVPSRERSLILAVSENPGESRRPPAYREGIGSSGASPPRRARGRSRWFRRRSSGGRCIRP